MSQRITSADRYRRILAMIPWIVEQGAPSLGDIAERFSITQDQVLADLDVVLLVGVPPYYPDDYIDVVYESDVVSVRLGDHFRRPLRLTATEALNVLIAGAGLAAAEPENGPLSRAMGKLRVALGVPDGAIEVALGPADSEVLATLRSGQQESTSVEIEYYTAGTDTLSQRLIDPHRIYSAEGHWYVAGHCHRAADQRVFRVDRIRSAVASAAHFEVPVHVPEPTVFEADEAKRRLVLDLAADAHWMGTTARAEAVERFDDGRRRVTLAVGGRAWMERVLLEAGPDATIVDSDSDSGTGTAAGAGAGHDVEDRDNWVPATEAIAIRREAATRILDRYR